MHVFIPIKYIICKDMYLEANSGLCVVGMSGFTCLKIFFLNNFIYLFMKDTGERPRQRHRQRKKQALCREPDVGLDPGSPGSCPGLKAGVKALSHPGIPEFL